MLGWTPKILVPHLSCWWWQVTRQVAQCKCAKRFQVEQIGENKYRVRQRGLETSPNPPFSHQGSGHHPGGAQLGTGGTRGEAETHPLALAEVAGMCFPSSILGPRAFPELGEHKSVPVLGQAARGPRETPHSLGRSRP